MSAPWVVMRSKNDAWVIGDTLRALRGQDLPLRILNIDSGSTDGTVDIIREFTDRLIQIQPHEYVAGRVLNRGMEETDGELVIFLNSDTTPTHPDWARRLLAPFEDARVAAVYGRQLPRPDAWPLFVRETETAFGDGRIAASWPHFFSMASSAIRRSVWAVRPFDPTLRYAEDHEWTWWARQQGHLIRYAADACAIHSHNYTWREAYRRYYGDAYALSPRFPLPRWRASWPFLFAAEALRDIARDARWCFGEGQAPGALFHSLALRPAQRWGKYRGYWAAMKDAR